MLSRLLNALRPPARAEEIADAAPPGIWHRPRSDAELVAQAGTSTGQAGDLADGPLVARIEAAYAAACRTPIDSDGGFWLREFAAMKEAEHRSLLDGTAGPMLRDPAHSRLFFGFDGLTVGATPDAMLGATSTYDGLLQLAVAIGAARAYNPEAAVSHPPPEVEQLLRKVDDVIGIRVIFPNPFPDEVGLATSRGIATFRSVQSLYQAWRMTRLVPDVGTARFLEIGAGLGRTAYYAYQLGARDYTLIDIPLSTAAQGYFLGRVLGDNAIRLYGEQTPAPIAVMPPVVFLEGSDQFDLVGNFDSLTEMSPSIADAYWRRIQGATRTFLSVNHEHNALTFRDLYTASGHSNLVTREPYWLRRGYVEEIAYFGVPI